MRRLYLAGTLGLAWLSTGCFSTQPSIQPFFDEGERTSVAGVVGSWLQKDDDPLRLTFQARSDGDYGLQVSHKENVGRGQLLVRFSRYDDRLYWDLSAEMPDDFGDAWGLHVMPLHSLARVTLAGNRLEIAPQDPQWFAEAVADNLVDTAHVRLDSDYLLLTATTADLRQLWMVNTETPGFFGKPLVFRRVAATVSSQTAKPGLGQ